MGPLAAIFRDRDLGELQRALATSTLADYAAGDVGLLTGLIEDAEPEPFAMLFPVLAGHGESAIRRWKTTSGAVARPTGPTPRRTPAWLDVPPDLRRMIESAVGMVEDRFILCQALPYERFRDLVERLDDCGFRPRCIRSYRVGASLLVAATWSRDGRPGRWLGEACSDELLACDADAREQGLVPIDVSIMPATDGMPPRCVAVWEPADDPETEVRLLAGPLGDPEPSISAGLAGDGYNCLTAQVVPDDRGRLHGVSIWALRQSQLKSTTRLFHDDSERFREDDCPGLLLTDVRLTWAEAEEGGRRRPVLLTTALWNVSTRYESRVLHGRPIMEHRVLGPQLAAEGFRPASISVAPSPDHGLPVAAVVWQRPLVPEESRDLLARRQANAAVALLRLGRGRRVWPMFRHLPDPRGRSYLIHRMGPLDADPDQVLARLDEPDDVSVRRALILTLGEFDEEQLPDARSEAIVPRLLDLYADHNDPGIHGAVAWTLRKWGRRVDVERVDRRFATGEPVGDRRWYVNRQGQTLAIIPAPGEIIIGSPPYEEGREGGPEGDVEMQRHVRIDHTFAIMPYTVTVAEFLRFRGTFYYRATFSPEPDCPINNLNWYEAASYCNWLNEQEGIPREQWCYLPNERGEYAQGMTIVPDGLRRNGYRLPTEAEWEFACRAGATTSRYYGQGADLDDHYAWTVRLALGRGTTPVGRFKPNDLGMFDMMGNIMEWIHDPYRIPPTRRRASPMPGPASRRSSATIGPTPCGPRATRPSAPSTRAPPPARSTSRRTRGSFSTRSAWAAPARTSRLPPARC